jgi:hypothetical protein
MSRPRWPASRNRAGIAGSARRSRVPAGPGRERQAEELEGRRPSQGQWPFGNQYLVLGEGRVPDRQDARPAPRRPPCRTVMHRAK